MCACVRVQARACVARAGGGGLKEKFCPRGCHTQHLPASSTPCGCPAVPWGCPSPKLVGVSLRLGIYGSSQQHHSSAPPGLAASLLIKSLAKRESHRRHCQRAAPASAWPKALPCSFLLSAPFHRWGT